METAESTIASSETLSHESLKATIQQTAEEASQLDSEIQTVVQNMNSESILEGSGLEEAAELESLNFQQGQSSIQQTLDEIQSLRLIDRELAKDEHKKNLGAEGTSTLAFRLLTKLFFFILIFSIDMSIDLFSAFLVACDCLRFLRSNDSSSSVSF